MSDARAFSNRGPGARVFIERRVLGRVLVGRGDVLAGAATSVSVAMRLHGLASPVCPPGRALLVPLRLQGG
eukprot:3027526-Lingulodinium_polyedra.AAC.1